MSQYQIRRIEKMICFGFLLLALSSCSDGKIFSIKEASAPTIQATHTPLKTRTPSPLPTSTKTNTPSNTPTPLSYCDELSLQLGGDIRGNLWKLYQEGWEREKIEKLANECDFEFEFYLLYGPTIELTNDIRITSLYITENIEEELNRSYNLIPNNYIVLEGVTITNNGDYLIVEYGGEEFVVNSFGDGAFSYLNLQKDSFGLFILQNQ